MSNQIPELDPQAAEVINKLRRGALPLWPFWDAVRAMIQEGTAAVEWTVDLAPFGVPRTVSAATLTLGEQVAIIEATDVGWEAFNPINDPRHALALLTACEVPHANTITTEAFDAAYSTAEERPANPS